MKILSMLSLPILLTSCVQLGSLVDRKTHGENPYVEPPFYSRYLSPSSALDIQIQERLVGLRQNPKSATLHNELGSLLVQKGFPKDAEREFFRAVANDDEFFPAWYNLGLIREARGDFGGASRALQQTINLKPGHAAAHFQLGLLEEKKGNTDRAIEHFAKAYSINHSLLNVRVNPRILDSKLVDRSLLHLYPSQHTRQSLQFQPSPAGYAGRSVETVSPESPAEAIVTPTPSSTDPVVQTPAPTPGQAPPPPPPTLTPPPAPPPLALPPSGPGRQGSSPT
ncbi:MAG TPA: tetratricopeptide repeat protein [Thermoanaerobaculia bacterium]|nr:tetratricopeptide repeat protein [Thermoanaerobaculia bacterium]